MEYRSALLLHYALFYIDAPGFVLPCFRKLVAQSASRPSYGYRVLE
jgi:hypothetical protein